MAINSQSLIMILAFVAAISLSGVSTATFGGRRALWAQDAAQGFVPLYPTHPRVLRLATFVIDEYNKEHDYGQLYFSHVYQAAYKKTPHGETYALLIIVNDLFGLKGYDVELSVQGNEKKILVFQKRPE